MKRRTKRIIKKFLKWVLNKLQYDIVSIKYKPLLANPPQLGNYSSPILSKEVFLKREGQIFRIKKKEIDGIELNERKQLALLKELKIYYNQAPFGGSKKKNLRYFYENATYCYSDAIFLYSMIRHFQPSKIIEIGSGFSSAVALDTIEHFLKNRCQCYFLDPDPERLLSLLKAEDRVNHKVVKSCVQDIDLVFFQQLKENDILFVDSTHVSKPGSDVNFIMFEILPALNRGVLIHFHDIFYPFEYPKKWILEGKAWNEDYILRAFLQYNSKFEILLFNTFLEYYYEAWFNENMPLCLKNRGGSIWLRKL